MCVRKCKVSSVTLVGECIYTALELADSVLASDGVRDTTGLAS